MHACIHTYFFQRGVISAIVDDHLIVNPQPRSVVRGQPKRVQPRVLDFQRADPLGREVARARHPLAHRVPVLRVCEGLCIPTRTHTHTHTRTATARRTRLVSETGARGAWRRRARRRRARRRADPKKR